MIDPFLAELQEECLKDPEGRLGFLREAAGDVVGNPNASLTKMIKICTEIESNFRSVGFVHSADLFGEFIGHMREIGQSFTDLGERVSPDDGFVLQFFLTDVVQSFENYYDNLKSSEDSAAKADEFRPAVKILSSWRPTAVEPALLKIVPSLPPEMVVHQAVSEKAAPVPPSTVDAAPATVNLESIATAIATNKVTATTSGVELLNKYLICRGPATTQKSQPRVFAIPVQQVIEVIDRQPVSALPFPRAGLEGILNFRGDPLPVLVCFDRNDDGARVEASVGKSYVVIANVDERKFGFQMENVLSVTDLDPSRFENPGSWLSPQGGTWVTHLVKQGDDVILVMDLKKAVVA